MPDLAITLRFMAEWPPYAIDEDERAAVLAGADALEELGRLRAFRQQVLEEISRAFIFLERNAS